MKKQSYNILVVTPESSSVDLSLQVLLADSELPNLSTYSSTSLQTTRALLEMGGLDAVVCQVELRSSKDLAMLQAIHETSPDLALVVVTGSRDRALQSWLLEAGVQDCLSAEELTSGLLQRSIKYAVESKQSELVLKRLSKYDPTTGLLTETAFLSILNRWVRRARKGGTSSFGLLVLQIAELQELLGSFDERLGVDARRAVARRVQDVARPGDAVAILDSNEIALLLPSVVRYHAHLAADRIASLLARPMTVGQQRLALTVRSGVTIFDRSVKSGREMLDATLLDLVPGPRQPPAPAASPTPTARWFV